MNAASLDKRPARLSHIRQAVAALVETLTPKFKEHRERIEALERRIAHLESRAVKFVGVWQQGTTYERNDMVQRGGSLWICAVPTTIHTPGQDFAAWRLAVKRGDA